MQQLLPIIVDYFICIRKYADITLLHVTIITHYCRLHHMHQKVRRYYIITCYNYYPLLQTTSYALESTQILQYYMLQLLPLTVDYIICIRKYADITLLHVTIITHYCRLHHMHQKVRRYYIITCYNYYRLLQTTSYALESTQILHYYMLQLLASSMVMVLQSLHIMF